MADGIAFALDRTAEILAERGWHQNESVDPESGAVCIMAALTLACTGSLYGTDDPTANELYVAAAGALQRQLRLDYGSTGSVADWNDTPHRELDEVLALLEAAAERQEVTV